MRSRDEPNAHESTATSKPGAIQMHALRDGESGHPARNTRAATIEGLRNTCASAYAILQGLALYDPDIGSRKEVQANLRRLRSAATEEL